MHVFEEEIIMKLNSSETRDFYKIIDNLLSFEKVQEMKKYIQHGNTTTFAHSKMVAYYSYWLSLRLPIVFDGKSIARGALLHDFYLYDWHVFDESHRLHGFYHPAVALANSRKYFKLNHIEEDIIKKHMWPLTLTKIPKYREAVLVCFVDKICSLVEILGRAKGSLEVEGDIY
jgi:uncharacterized protein